MIGDFFVHATDLGPGWASVFANRNANEPMADGVDFIKPRPKRILYFDSAVSELFVISCVFDC